MVGYNPSEEQVPWYIITMAGGASGFFTRAVTQPLDVIKIRLQVQDTPWNRQKYKGTLNSMKKMAMEEGRSALWKGHLPAQVLSVLYGVVQFPAYELLTRLSHPILSVSSFLQPLQDFICGSLAGLPATIFSYPFDVVRTRYIIQGNPPVYNSMRQSFHVIVKKESIRGLYRGLVPTMIQIAPNTGFQFAFFHLSSQLWDFTFQKLKFSTTTAPTLPCNDTSSKGNQATTTTQPSVSKSLICGSLAGLGAKSIVYPLDFTKKRLQAEGVHSYSTTVVGKAHFYRGFIHCFVTVVKREGLLALYKGFVPSSLKAITTSALIFSSYEHFKHFFSNIHFSLS